MEIKISKEILNNLFIFLDRVEIKGLKEIQAMNQLLDVFYSVKENNTTETPQV